MMNPVESINQFVAYARTLKGDEKGEAQVFLRPAVSKPSGTAATRKPVQHWNTGSKERRQERRNLPTCSGGHGLLIEMKKRGEKLQRHYSQAFEYWLQLVPHRPKYVVLCNFDEFWIYDFDLQLNDPVDMVALGDLPHRYTAFNFLFPVEKKPQFGNNRVDVTRAAADKVAAVFNSVVSLAAKTGSRPNALPCNVSSPCFRKMRSCYRVGCFPNCSMNAGAAKALMT